jgi:hypothetical protein
MLSMSSFVLSNDEIQHFDKLLGTALVDDGIYRRLLLQRDESLFDEFQLTDRMQSWLRNVPATSLSELARAIVPSFASD